MSCIFMTRTHYQTKNHKRGKPGIFLGPQRKRSRTRRIGNLNIYLAQSTDDPLAKVLSAGGENELPISLIERSVGDQLLRLNFPAPTLTVQIWLRWLQNSPALP